MDSHNKLLMIITETWSKPSSQPSKDNSVPPTLPGPSTQFSPKSLLEPTSTSTLPVTTELKSQSSSSSHYHTPTNPPPSKESNKATLKPEIQTDHDIFKYLYFPYPSSFHLTIILTITNLKISDSFFRYSAYLHENDTSNWYNSKKYAKLRKSFLKMYAHRWKCLINFNT